ncbi:MAG TPA: hypothetical protein VGI54_04770 [Solirubrobacteraceae bacterium]
MNEHSVSRTLVKSPPELWAELSDPAALARHLGEFGEITITRLEPERSVAWEGERARGTVALEPAGWGTRVTLAVVAEEVAVADEVEEAEDPAPDPLPAAQEEPEPPEEEPEPPGQEPEPASLVATEDPAEKVLSARPGFFARLFGRRRPAEQPVAAAEEVAVEAPSAVEEAAEEDPSVVEPMVEEPAAEEPPAEAPAPPSGIEAVLTATLDTLGGANHRPFSRG